MSISTPLRLPSVESGSVVAFDVAVASTRVSTHARIHWDPLPGPADSRHKLD